DGGKGGGADGRRGRHGAGGMGSGWAGTVGKRYPLLTPIQGEGLRAKSEIVKLPLPPITAEDLAQAKGVLKRINDPKTTFLEKVKAYQVLDVAAREGRPQEVEVQVIALGAQVAWVSLPGEIFVELGMAV